MFSCVYTLSTRLLGAKFSLVNLSLLLYIFHVSAHVPIDVSTPFGLCQRCFVQGAEACPETNGLMCEVGGKYIVRRDFQCNLDEETEWLLARGPSGPKNIGVFDVRNKISRTYGVPSADRPHSVDLIEDVDDTQARAHLTIKGHSGKSQRILGRKLLRKKTGTTVYVNPNKTVVIDPLMDPEDLQSFGEFHEDFDFGDRFKFSDSHNSRVYPSQNAVHKAASELRAQSLDSNPDARAPPPPPMPVMQGWRMLVPPLPPSPPVAVPPPSRRPWEDPRKWLPEGLVRTDYTSPPPAPVPYYTLPPIRELQLVRRPGLAGENYFETLDLIIRPSRRMSSTAAAWRGMDRVPEHWPPSQLCDLATFQACLYFKGPWGRNGKLLGGVIIGIAWNRIDGESCDVDDGVLPLVDLEIPIAGDAPRERRNTMIVQFDTSILKQEVSVSGSGAYKSSVSTKCSALLSALSRAFASEYYVDEDDQKKKEVHLAAIRLVGFSQHNPGGTAAFVAFTPSGSRDLALYFSRRHLPQLIRSAVQCHAATGHRVTQASVSSWWGISALQEGSTESRVPHHRLWPLHVPGRQYLPSQLELLELSTPPPPLEWGNLTEKPLFIPGHGGPNRPFVERSDGTRPVMAPFISLQLVSGESETCHRMQNAFVSSTMCLGERPVQQSDEEVNLSGKARISQWLTQVSNFFGDFEVVDAAIVLFGAAFLVLMVRIYLQFSRHAALYRTARIARESPPRESIRSATQFRTMGSAVQEPPQSAIWQGFDSSSYPETGDIKSSTSTRGYPKVFIEF